MAISRIVQWHGSKENFNIPGYRAEYSVIDNYAFDILTRVIMSLRQIGIKNCDEFFGSIDFADLTVYVNQSETFKQAVGEVSALREICIRNAFPDVATINESFEP